MEQMLRPLPFKEKNIVDVSTADIKVAVSGLIIDKDETSFSLDDGIAQIRVLTTEDWPLTTYVRVYGKVLPEALNADIIQDFSIIDKLLYKKVKDILSKKEV
jgi:hypothetical protein